MADENDAEPLTLATLTNKLHAPVPFSKTYVFKGAEGTFIINKDRQTPTERILAEE